MKYLFLLLMAAGLYAQSGFSATLDSAYVNAKKGVYWAFAHIPENKKSETHDIILDDKLVCEVKLYKEVDGVKVDVTGYFNTTTVQITSYKSYATLRSEGFLNNKDKSFFDKLE